MYRGLLKQLAVFLKVVRLLCVQLTANDMVAVYLHVPAVGSFQYVVLMWLGGRASGATPTPGSC